MPGDTGGQTGTVEHFADLGTLTMCDEHGTLRTGVLIDVPLLGNEMHWSTLRDANGDLHAIAWAEVRRVVGREFRRF